ncbi:histidine phosphatase family protein [Microbispora sp. RL4-1S]|uniref:Histidine phosphatase family protein n=1 Tax=Microbispora oryzae TaxID=2806554 RepID=A0A940WIN1_9ACTN|nr:histidine phosphatase family protein [Microbispora oryzae]MBP2706295.1 histidine phosphatase family protein [Microbispora oryzae]
MNRITAVRHGQSTANAALARAVRDGLAVRIPGRDADIELSPYGRAQAAAVGDWLAGDPDDRMPHAVWCSPYRRARETWSIAAERLRAAGIPAPTETVVDARLRDRELGELELLTPAAVAARFPADHARMDGPEAVSHRPRGGESFADMAGRVRAALDDMDRAAAGLSVLVVAHDAIVLLIRHLLDAGEPSDVGRVLGYGQVGNGSVSRWHRRGTRLEQVAFNQTAHLPVERPDPSPR